MLKKIIIIAVIFIVVFLAVFLSVFFTLKNKTLSVEESILKIWKNLKTWKNNGCWYKINENDIRTFFLNYYGEEIITKTSTFYHNDDNRAIVDAIKNAEKDGANVIFFAPYKYYYGKKFNFNDYKKFNPYLRAGVCNHDTVTIFIYE